MFRAYRARSSRTEDIRWLLQEGRESGERQQRGVSLGSTSPPMRWRGRGSAAGQVLWLVGPLVHPGICPMPRRGHGGGLGEPRSRRDGTSAPRFGSPPPPQRPHGTEVRLLGLVRGEEAGLEILVEGQRRRLYLMLPAVPPRTALVHAKSARGSDRGGFAGRCR